MIAIIAVVVVLGVGGAAAILLTDAKHDHRPVAARSTAPTSPSTNSTGDPGGPSTPSSTSTDKPSVRGWQAIVASRVSGLTYDVPKDWKNNGKGVQIGLDDGSQVPETTVSFTASHKRGSCSLGGTGFRAAKPTDLTDSAKRGARMWARSAEHKTDSPKSSVGGPAGIRLTGLNRARHVTVRVSHGPDKDNCGSTGTTIHVIALPVRGGGSLLFVLWVHTGISGAVGDADMNKITHSVRLDRDVRH